MLSSPSHSTGQRELIRPGKWPLRFTWNIMAQGTSECTEALGQKLRLHCPWPRGRGPLSPHPFSEACARWCLGLALSRRGRWKGVGWSEGQKWPPRALVSEHLA